MVMLEQSTVLNKDSELRHNGRNGHSEQSGKAINPVVGTWRLVSIEDIRPNGEIVYWMGQKPAGIIMYDATGHMSVQFMRDPRPTFAAEYNRATLEEIKSAYEGYFAYFGTYEVDEEKSTVMHHLEGSLRPQEVGIDYQRAFKLSGDRLVLSMRVPGKEERTRNLVWERAQ
jgi:hypothetical protein